MKDSKETTEEDPTEETDLKLTTTSPPDMEGDHLKDSTTMEAINRDNHMEDFLNHPMKKEHTRTEVMREDHSTRTQREKDSETQTMSLFILTSQASSMCSL